MMKNIESPLGIFRVSRVIMTVTCLIATLLVAGKVSAVTVTATQSANFGPVNGGVFSVPYQVQNPDSVVVFGTYIDNANALTSLGFGTGVGDQAADGFISADRSSLSYFLDPSTGAGLSFNGTTPTTPDGASAGYAIWELAGVDLSALVQSASGTSGSLQISTIAANSFITDMLGVNDFGITDVSPDGDAVQLEISQVFVVPGGGQLAMGQATVGAAGTYNLGWTVTGGSGNYGETAFAFVPIIPEPATCSLLLGGLGMMTLLRRRKAIC